MSNIIYSVLRQLQSDELFGSSLEIELCKGKNQIPKNIKHRLYKIKRWFFMFLR